MGAKRRWLLVLGVLLLTTGVGQAQFMVRGGFSGGTGTGSWGRTWGFFFGMDELLRSRSYGWWSSRLDIGRSYTGLSDGSRITALKIVDPYSQRPDTMRLENAFSATTIAIGGRYEPCLPSLGFRQTSHRIVSPFVGWHLGYSRLEHDRAGSARGLAGTNSAHGVPVGGSVGLLVGWGGPPKTALDPNVSSTYWGMEISLDVTTTVWLKNRELIAPMAALPEGLSAPLAPTISLRVMAMYRTAPVRKR